MATSLRTPGQAALRGLKDGSLKILVATDIAARGIDVDELSHVINYDLPNIPETYGAPHRAHGAGRRVGDAISFCDFDEKAYLKDIEKLTRKAIPVVEDHPFPMQVFEPAPKPSRDRPAETRRSRRKGTGSGAASIPPAAGRASRRFPAGANPKRRMGKRHVFNTNYRSYLWRPGRY